MPECSLVPKSYSLLPLFFVALLNSISTYLLNYIFYHSSIIYYIYCWFSYYLWSIALPTKDELLIYDLSQDEQINVSPAVLTTS